MADLHYHITEGHGFPYRHKEVWRVLTDRIKFLFLQGVFPSSIADFQEDADT